MDDSPSRPRTAPRFLRALGPALIVACVVLGPGSILTASKVGADYGYSMIWVLVGTIALMIGMVALSARLGVAMNRTLCGELADRVGPGFAMFIGVVVFLIIACFQSSNNVAVLAAVEAFSDVADKPVIEAPAPPEGADTGTARAPVPAEARDAEAAPPEQGADSFVPEAVLLAINVLIIAVMFGLRRLYQPIEKLMMLLVGIMIVGFAGNLFFARPAIGDVLWGFIPQWPSGEAAAAANGGGEEGWVGPLLAVQGLIGTTFSAAAAFYQAYLVREKGWTLENLRQGLVDSIAGISVLGGITLMIMITSAAAFHGTDVGGDMSSFTDVARQLEPAFGRWAMILFSVGIFAGAFSSFLVNALIGGTLLADGLGRGGGMDRMGTKACTTAVLLIGLAVAMLTSPDQRLNVIIVAQAMTVVGVPLLAATLLYLATRPDLVGNRRIPAWMKIAAVIGMLVTLSFAVRTVWKLYGTLLG